MLLLAGLVIIPAAMGAESSQTFRQQNGLMAFEPPIWFLEGHFVAREKDPTYIFGPVKSAKGYSTNQLKLYEAEDIVTASFAFEPNILGIGLWCFTSEADQKIDKTRITGSEGVLTFSFFELNLIEIIKGGETSSYSIDHPQHVHQPMIDTVVRDILGRGKCISTGDSGARTNWVLGQILTK